MFIAGIVASRGVNLDKMDPPTNFGKCPLFKAFPTFIGGSPFYRYRQIRRRGDNIVAQPPTQAASQHQLASSRTLQKSQPPKSVRLEGLQEASQATTQPGGQPTSLGNQPIYPRNLSLNPAFAQP